MTPASPYRLIRTPPPAPAAPSLDAAQQRVVDHASGPLLVLAGPGTGKTTTLVEAVIDRVERRGLAPEQVLVLTFSRKAADELRERITTRLGRTITEPSAYTFHSWCYALVRAWQPDPLRPPVRLLSGAERDVRIRDLLAGNAAGLGKTQWPDDLAAALTTRGMAREVADLLDRARERGVDGAVLAALGKETGRDAWVGAGTFFDEYLDVLDDQNALDYAELVRRAIALLERPEVLAELRQRYHAVFVDEYQDTDPAQERLLALLAGQGRDLVVVGDPDQSIYSFRGADVTGLLQFPDRFRTTSGAPAPVVTLDVSRRSGPALLEVSRRIAERIPTPLLPADARRRHRALRAATSAETAAAGEAGIHLYPTVADEVTAIADLLRRAHLEDNLPWSHMAVLVRSGVRSIGVLRRAFAASSVPVAVAADEVPVARDPAVAPLLAALRAAASADTLTPDTARLLLSSPLGGALPSGLRLLGRRLRHAARDAGEAFPPPSSMLVRDAVADPTLLLAVPDDWAAEPVRRVAALIAAAREVLSAGGSAEEALWAVWESSRWGRRLAARALAGGQEGQAADRDLDAVLAVFAAVARLEERQPRTGVTALLAELESQEIPGRPMEEHSARSDAVRLLTAHRAKGLEWDLVVVCGVQDGVWPDLRRRGSLLESDLVDSDGVREPASAATLLADERRLFYVALTRARRRLVVTAVQSIDEAADRPSRFLDELGVEPVVESPGAALLSPSSLVARMRRALDDETMADDVRAAAAAQLAALARVSDAEGNALVPAANPASWWGLRETTPGARPVRDPEQPLELSGSALRSYVECPLRWFFERGVYAKGQSSAAQGYGIVVHALVQLVSDGILPADPDVLLAQLDTVWSSLAFEAAWERDRERDDAHGTLRRFLTWQAGDNRAVAGSEVPFVIELGDVRLRGRADRLEVDADGGVHVVDFKTGKNPLPKDALPQDAQLGVYQLAAREGGFAAVLGDGPPALGGAELVWLRQERKGGLPNVQQQDALPDERPTWADDLVLLTGKSVRAEHFPARPEDSICRRCDFRSCCPAQDGRQVVE
ncbi:MAG: ATP-dependent helicase [Mycobacteriales bacterium]